MRQNVEISATQCKHFRYSFSTIILNVCCILRAIEAWFLSPFLTAHFFSPFFPPTVSSSFHFPPLFPFLHHATSASQNPVSNILNPALILKPRQLIYKCITLTLPITCPPSRPHYLSPKATKIAADYTTCA